MSAKLVFGQVLARASRVLVIVIAILTWTSVGYARARLLLLLDLIHDPKYTHVSSRWHHLMEGNCVAPPLLPQSWPKRLTIRGRNHGDDSAFSRPSYLHCAAAGAAVQVGRSRIHATLLLLREA